MATPAAEPGAFVGNTSPSERISTDFKIGMPGMKPAGTAGRPSSPKRDAIFASRLCQRVIHVNKPLKWCFKQRAMMVFLGKYICLDQSRLFLLTATILVVILAFLSQGRAVENSLTPRQMEIIQTVLNVDGFISKELHDEFWALMPPAIRDDAKTRDIVIRFIDRTLTASVRFQRESWASIKASMEASRVVKSPSYAIAKKSVLSASTNPQYQRQAQKGVADAEAMIKAVAEGKPFQMPRGLIYITPELVNQTLAGLDGSFARFRRLASLEWEETVTKYRYPNAHVAILSQVPFAEEKQELTLENGQKVLMTVLTNRPNETDFFIIAFNDYGGAWADPERAIVNKAKASLTGAGFSPSGVFSSKWRSRLSASTNGQTITPEGALYASTRVIEMRELGGALVFTAITKTSKFAADMLRESLERSTQVLR